MTIELDEEQISFIYNILKSGIYFPDEESKDPFIMSLKNKFLLHSDIGKSGDGNEKP